jgi:UDP-N-acetylmuramoyl-L-alanyl-D-glutamate--2,6-diaminopimelate ligase
MIKGILEEAGYKTGIIGTLYASIGAEKKEQKHTTPEAPEIEAFLKECLEQEADYVVMEVSSHALALNRVGQLIYHSAIFTNLTQDHLDFHQDMEKYKNAKIELFKMLERPKGAFGIVNADDTYRDDFIGGTQVKSYTFGFSEAAEIKALKVEATMNGTKLSVQRGPETLDLQMSFIGSFNVYNALAAIAFAWQEGIKPEIIKNALAKMTGVAGRFETVDCGQDFVVVVDYAHTPDGLRNILKTAREITLGRIITVFGCGGDRDREKRPLMGEIAAEYSDFTIITTDNPRHEEPESIIADIVPGVEKIINSRYAIIVDRYEAIHHAISLAKKNDMVILAGKGHETYQLVQDQRISFDDRLVAAELIKGSA